MKHVVMMSSLLVFMGCGGAEEPAPAPEPAVVEAPKATPTPAPTPEPEPEVPVVVDDGSVATVTITGSDQMKYNTDRIEITAGRTVKLTLKHVGVVPAAAMGHNFVLLKQGTDTTAFTSKAIMAKETNYIPADMKDMVIANTTVVGGGESVTIEFAAPAAGTYDFLCSFPGHAAMMKGKFVVTAG
jgi:azurin